MTDHITAAELRRLAGEWRGPGFDFAADTLARAAAALDALNARIAELEGMYEQAYRNNALLRSKLLEIPSFADAELGALVRRWRDHPERKFRGLLAGGMTVEELTKDIAELDTLAASREAEQGVEGPSGTRYRWMNGDPETRDHYGKWWGLRGTMTTLPYADIPTVAALIERHGGGATHTPLSAAGEG